MSRSIGLFAKRDTHRPTSEMALGRTLYPAGLLLSPPCMYVYHELRSLAALLSTKRFPLDSLLFHTTFSRASAQSCPHVKTLTIGYYSVLHAALLQHVLAFIRPSSLYCNPAVESYGICFLSHKLCQIIEM